MIRRHITDNELCPCGSGKKYKNCCKGKISKNSVSKKPPEVQAMEKMRASLKKMCLYPDHDSCRGKIKEAHALQNNKIIFLLAGEEHHVYMLDPKRKPTIVQLNDNETETIVEISRVSANDATTETCFCDYHDTIAFAPIEKDAPDFNDSNDEMCFLYAYKAFIFEYYKIITTIDSFRACFFDNPNAFLNKSSVGLYRMLQLQLAEFEPIKKYYDTHILTQDYSGLYTCAVKIDKVIKFANYAYIAPNHDMNGKKIKHTVNNKMHRLSLTIFPEKTHSWILMSCTENEKKYYFDFFQQIQSASLDKIKLYFNFILPLYSENIVLSPDLWNSWDDKTKMLYTMYANFKGKDAMVMDMGIGFGLKNAHRDKSGQSYQTQPKFNLFI